MYMHLPYIIELTLEKSMFYLVNSVGSVDLTFALTNLWARRRVGERLGWKVVSTRLIQESDKVLIR